jgi:hypothetical protein
MKSGTHLVQELMAALGYGIYGQARIPPEIRPVLDDQTRWRIARIVYDPQTLATLAEAGPEHFRQATDEAWEALGWSWQLRFGMPLVRWYSAELINTRLVEEAHQRAIGSDFLQTPDSTCWIFNEFDIRKLDGHFMREWAETGEPRILFNYRDPRDMLLSMVNFLAGRTGKGFSNFSDFQVLCRILQAKDSLEEQLSYALSDTSFPIHGDLERAVWLLHHPDVCQISFEELVGPEGGGSAEARTQAVGRVLDHLGVTDVTADEVTGKLFNPDSFTFFKGQIGGWRESFTPAHRELAQRRFGDVLEIYGYA